MNILIGDIGNTVTKICLVRSKTMKVKKIIFFDSKNITEKNFVKKKLRGLIKNKSINKVALFSSVVPKYYKQLKKSLKAFYKIELKEIKEKKIIKKIKINIKNTNQIELVFELTSY